MNLVRQVAFQGMKAILMSTWLALLVGFVLGANFGFLLLAMFAARSSN
jgi:hypothetical protein